jgi:hypothetical protein
MTLNRAFTPCDACVVPKDFANQEGVFNSINFKHATNLISQMAHQEDMETTFEEDVNRAMRLADVPERLKQSVSDCAALMLDGVCQREQRLSVVTVKIANERL